MGLLVVVKHDVADVSVALPVFNGERYLQEALQSVLDQTVRPVEILVFDNCSTDRTVELARQLIPFEAVRVSESNIGAAANFNRAARESVGEYFLWLAVDDRLTPHHLERCLQVLAERPDAGACLPGIRYIDPAGRPIRAQSDEALASVEPRERIRSFVRRGRWTEVYCLYRRDALLASPMISDGYASDVFLTWWFVLRGSLAVARDPLLEYREYPTKTADEMAQALDPNARALQWRMTRLWLGLWRESAATDVDPSTSRVARRELLLCLVHRHWLWYATEDVWVYLTSVARGRGPAARVLSRLLTTVESAARGRRLRRRSRSLLP